MFQWAATQEHSVYDDDDEEDVEAGMETIIEDLVTSRFKAEELASWNLLTRTSFGYQHINWKLTILWVLGFIFRYFILFPVRLVLFFVGLFAMIAITSLVGYVPNKRENRAKHGGICVANHTSPIDVMILSCDNCYAMVGQRQGGFLGERLHQEIFQDGEDAIAFARRVKRAIAEKGGLVDLEWDGGLKRARVPPKLIAQHQKMYWDRLSRKTSINTQNLETAARVTAEVIADETLHEALKEGEQGENIGRTEAAVTEVRGDEAGLIRRFGKVS
uniref:Phospholipid/glycerol acyltransferase domain-containing protein n=1 Tax=Parascaris equorum TaxID=6256 RepID=A0A914RXE9_PAREQ